MRDALLNFELPTHNFKFELTGTYTSLRAPACCVHTPWPATHLLSILCAVFRVRRSRIRYVRVCCIDCGACRLLLFRPLRVSRPARRPARRGSTGVRALGWLAYSVGRARTGSCLGQRPWITGGRISGAARGNGGATPRAARRPQRCVRDGEGQRSQRRPLVGLWGDAGRSKRAGSGAPTPSTRPIYQRTLTPALQLAEERPLPRLLVIFSNPHTCQDSWLCMESAAGSANEMSLSEDTRTTPGS